MTASTPPTRPHKTASVAPPPPRKSESKRKPGRPAASAASDAAEHRFPHVLSYPESQSVDTFVRLIAHASPMELIDLERRGVQGRFIKDLSKRISLPAVRFYEILGVPKATVEKRVAEGTEVSGSGGHAALAMARLLAQAQTIVEDSTAPAAEDFDTGRWLGQWIEHPQPALGGRKPAELIATPTGYEVVSRLLGALESGAYQ